MAMNSGYYENPSVHGGVGAYWPTGGYMLPAVMTTSAGGETYPPISDQSTMSYAQTVVPEYSVVPTMSTNCDLSTTSVTTDDSYRQHDSPSSVVSKSSPGGSRRRTVNRLPPHVDPCLLAPLRKRRIDENVLPPTEREKLLMKRHKNRDAAAKCRVKKKANVEKLKEEHAEICRRNQVVEEDIRNLVREKDELERILREHHCTQKVQA